MAKETTKEKKGFTIIEVVLVLAIAGLIFLMVFVAFPALQRSRNDSQRRQDYADLASNIMTEAGNSNGGLFKKGGTSGTFTLPAGTYVNSSGQDPSGTNYTVTVKKLGESADALEVGKIFVYYDGVICDADGISPTSGGVPHSFVVYGFMEGGDGKYCSANEY